MDIKLVLMAVGLGFTILASGFNVAVWCIMRFNDFAHLQKSVEELKYFNKNIEDKLTGILERISKIEGFMQQK